MKVTLSKNGDKGFHIKIMFCCNKMRNFVGQTEVVLYKSNHDLNTLIGETDFNPQHNFKFCPFCGSEHPLELSYTI